MGECEQQICDQKEETRRARGYPEPRCVLAVPAVHPEVLWMFMDGLAREARGGVKCFVLVSQLCSKEVAHPLWDE